MICLFSRIELWFQLENWDTGSHARELLASAEFMHAASPQLSLPHWNGCSILTNTMNLFSPRINTDWAQQSHYARKPRTPRLWNVKRNRCLNPCVLKSHYVFHQVCVDACMRRTWHFAGHELKIVLVLLEMNHSCFNISSGNLSSLPHTGFNSGTVKEHLALNLEHNSVSV